MTKNKKPSNHQHPGAAHYEAIKDRFIDTKPARTTINVDLDRAGVILIGAQKEIDDRGMSTVLKMIPKTMFDAKNVGDFARYGWTLRYIATMRKTETAAAASTRLDPELAARAEETKARMLKVATHFLGEHPVHGKEVDSIREGRGHEDLAQDLVRLARLYRLESAIVSTDPVHYRATDADDAQALYVQITESLNANVDGEWNDIALKAFSFIEREYWHLRQTIAWAWRDEPAVLDAFPTLFQRSTNGKAAEEVAPVAPAPVAPPVS